MMMFGFKLHHGKKGCPRESDNTPVFQAACPSAEPPETDVGHRHALASAGSCRFG
jgi:hypothetical protein